MNDKEYMRLALQLAKKGLRMDIAQPDGGCRCRKRGQDHRTGLAPEIRSGSCGAQCAGILHRRSAGSDPVCDIGAVAAITESSRPAWMRFWTRAFTGWSWVLLTRIRWWLEKELRILRAHGIDVTRKCSARGMRCAEQGVLPLYHHKTPLRFHEIRHDDGRKNRHIHRRFQMDHRGNCPESCSTAATPIPRHYGGSRNHPSR